MPDFGLKDSGVRQVFDSGMVRDVTDDKTDYTLALDGPMFDRWAEHLTKGAKKYDARNWMKAQGNAEYERFKQSAFRHFLQWFRGEQDEDHAAAVFFNINGAEYVDGQMDAYQDTAEAWFADEGPDVHGCDGCDDPDQSFIYDSECGCVNCESYRPVSNQTTPFVISTDFSKSAKVGDVDADDILDAISQPGGAGDLADDYNYLRRRVQELSNQLNRGVVDEFEEW